MSLHEKITQEELALYEIIRHPVLCGEFINNYDKLGYEEKFEYSEYQKEILCNFNNWVSICAGRAVGKCLAETSMILNPKTGEYRSIKEWYTRGGLDSIVSIDDSWGLKISKPTIEPNGVVNILHIKTQAGYEVDITPEHPLLTNAGFKNASDIAIGDFIAVANEIPFFGSDNMDELSVSILAHFIAEGSYHNGGITTTEESVISDIYKYADSIGGYVRKDSITYYISKIAGHKNEYLKLLESNGLRDRHSYNKFIPQSIFRLNKEALGLFLNKLFGDDGWVLCNGQNNEVGYSTTSKELAFNIRHILLRFGISASLQYKKNKKLGSWNLSIKGSDNFEKFYRYIGFSIKRKQDKLKECLSKSKNFYNQFDIIPIPNYYKYRKNNYKSKSKDAYTSKLKYYPTRQKIVNSIINTDNELLKYSQKHIRWVRVKSIEYVNNVETYSIEVNKTNTLLADDVYSHNTVSLVNLIIWCLINNVYPGDYLCYHVPGKSHVEPVFNGLVLAFRTNNVLKHFIDKNSGVNRSDLTIRLNNGSSLLCRIAGQSGTGVAVVGLHSPFVIVDEAGYYPYGTWLELIPTVNQFTSGFRVLVSGVPTGLRERNVLFHTDQENESYSKHRISALSNPRFTKEDNERAIDMYGGDDTEDYIHLVLGEHGKPVFALFDRNSMDIQSYPVYKISIDGTQLHNDLTAYIQKLSVLPNLHNKTDECIFGIDLGFTEPTAISILSINSLGVMKFHARLTLSKVNYHIQEKIIDYLDTRFTPKIIGIDEGSSGKAVIPRLLEHEDFIHKGYKDRLVGVNFSGWTVLGTDTNGEEIKNKTKPLSVSILQDYTINHKIVYSSADMDMIIELERMTYVKNPQGDITYRTLTERGGKKGDDHFTSSLLCMAMAYYTKLGNFNFRPQRAKLLAPRWTF